MIVSKKISVNRSNIFCYVYVKLSLNSEFKSEMRWKVFNVMWKFFWFFFGKCGFFWQTCKNLWLNLRLIFPVDKYKSEEEKTLTRKISKLNIHSIGKKSTRIGQRFLSSIGIENSVSSKIWLKNALANFYFFPLDQRLWFWWIGKKIHIFDKICPTFCIWCSKFSQTATWHNHLPIQRGSKRGRFV